MCVCVSQINGREFMPLRECPGVCQANGSAGRLHMQTRGSKFVKFQEVRVQELPEQVPVGNIPRSMTCIARGDMCRRASPGDIVTVTGIFLPTPYTVSPRLLRGCWLAVRAHGAHKFACLGGRVLDLFPQGFKAMRAGLITDTYLDVQSLERLKKSYAELELTEEMENKIEEAASQADIYSQLARSLAPEIYGHVDVKKALLLQLVGGVTRQMQDGMRIRGDINICLMGDPGVAKSQLLKHITSVAPRGVYTTGKGSSGVGLTAAVLRDPVTKELTLEGGALVMADKGICCIDEFDKMEDADRTAIHEVMEQQTVSIAKAGITTTLNARTAILAAANPLYGRYNRRLTPTQNINLPAALLSRFDLLFLILDKPDEDGDLALARHITYVHQHGRHPPLDFEPLEPAFIRAYIAEARQIDPWVPKEVSSSLVESYVAMRAKEVRDAAAANEQSVMTARRLLSILRLSQALARLRFADSVAEEDVNEAIRLVHMSSVRVCSTWVCTMSPWAGRSPCVRWGLAAWLWLLCRLLQASLIDDDATMARSGDAVSKIFEMITTEANRRGELTLKYAEMEAMATRMGYSKDKFVECLNEYSDINVLMVDADNTSITIVADE